MTDKALEYLERSDGWEIGAGPSIVVVNSGMGKSFTSTTLRERCLRVYLQSARFDGGAWHSGVKDHQDQVIVVKAQTTPTESQPKRERLGAMPFSSIQVVLNPGAFSLNRRRVARTCQTSGTGFCRSASGRAIGLWVTQAKPTYNF